MLRAYTALVAIMYVNFAPAAIAGPFNNVGISRNDSSIDQWAATVVSYQPAPGVAAAFSDPAAALGPADESVVSLGDLDGQQIGEGVPPGAITMAFATPIRNGPDWDLLVFENAAALFPPPFVFGELAYLEASSDGVHFARFPSVSLNVEPGQGVAGETELNTTFGRAFAGINITNVSNLAGIHPGNFGTAFDLDDLSGMPLVQSGDVDLHGIRFVRLIDIPGNGAFLDSQGRAILDAWVTRGTGGLDLDAIGARYAVPEPTTDALTAAAIVLVVLSARKRRYGH
jgi:hypothetical protein